MIFSERPVYSLPIHGFKDRRFHTLTLGYKVMDVIKNRWIIITHHIINELRGEGINLDSLIGFFKLCSDLDECIEANNLLSMNIFIGIQPISSGSRGITFLKDGRIDAYNSKIHRIINPNEYIIFGHNVRATADGVVSEIINKYRDALPTTQGTDLSSEWFKNYNNLMGNIIVVDHPFGLSSIYGNMKQNSFTKKVGDKVSEGEVIGQVGSSGKEHLPSLLFATQIISQDLLYKTERIFKPSYNSNLWKPHYSWEVEDFKDLREDDLAELFSKGWMYKPNYKLTNNHLDEVVLVKQYQNISQE